MTYKHIIAAVLVVAAATTVSGANPEVAKATVGITHVDFSAVHSRIIAQMKRKHFAPHSRGSVVRGRSLIETKLCEYDATESVCDPGLEALKNFKPATPEGQQLVDMLFKPEIECRALTTMATCVANSKCVFEDNECTSNFEAIMGSPPPSSCKDSEKTPVTLTTLSVTGGSKCGAITDKATCQLAAEDGCEWSDGDCNFDSFKLMSDMMMNFVGPTSTVGTFMRIGMIADECEMKGMTRRPPTDATDATNANGEATCKADSRCEWKASTSECDISSNATMSAMGVEDTNAMTDLNKKMMTCVLSNASSCAAPCELDSSNACILGQDELVKSVYSGMEDGPMKTMMMSAFACSVTTNASTATCESKGRDCTFSSGSSSCDYSPDESMSMQLMTSPMPGYEARCPSLLDKVFNLTITCIKNDVSTCPATCQVSTEEEGSTPTCTASDDSIFFLMAGDEDGKNMAQVEKTCGQHKGNEASCKAQTMDLDFFGKKNPSKKKVKTTIAFKGVTKVDAEATQKMKTAIASTVGGDVKAEDIFFTKIHFPVKATLKLSTSMTDVTADKSAFEAKFKKGAAADLKVNEADIVISAITEASRRRGLLATGVNVAFTVENAADATTAQAISSSISTATALTSLANQTGATASVAEAPSFELEVEMEVATADAAAVSTKIADTGTATALVNSLATAGIPGATVTVTETPTVQENSSKESSSNRVHPVVLLLVVVFALIFF